ncbi:MAG: hypothetical protein GDA36_13690 [Rhodobacteraceae bacterium]|nr:hypothetical protein [Paracoccaceae bacterium]
MADLTARAGMLDPALAVHFANNVGALLFVLLPNNLNKIAAWRDGFHPGCQFADPACPARFSSDDTGLPVRFMRLSGLAGLGGPGPGLPLTPAIAHFRRPRII